MCVLSVESFWLKSACHSSGMTLASLTSAMSMVFKLMPMVPMAELVWCAVACIRVDELFVNFSADYSGSTAPSRRHSRSCGIPFEMGYAFVGEQFRSLESSSW